MPPGTIALTFDDGPDPHWTPLILDVLARHHAHATFFVIGSRVNEYPDLARRIVAEGNEIGVHTFTHAELSTAAGVAAAAGADPDPERDRRRDRPDGHADAPAVLVRARRGHRRRTTPP